MNEDYIRYLFKYLPFDYVVDYAFMCIKIKLENEINKKVEEIQKRWQEEERRAKTD